jgi:ketosteroid isomerase-like protein
MLREESHDELRRQAMKLWLMMSVTLVVKMSASVAAEQRGLTTEECTVWQRESDFARSVDNHDMSAFASFIDLGAVFNAGSTAPLRGRNAIVEHWRGIVSGAPVKLVWRPHIVTISGGGNTAFSTGPYVMINKKPDAQNPYLVGDFITIWSRKNRNAQWLVTFDSGTDPKPAPSEAEALAHLDGAPKTCPGP